MSINKSYVSKVGTSYKISDHFSLGEMRCKDGSDMVLYSSELIDMLEKLRAYGGFTLTINSGYRTAAYNKKIGGATSSQHIKGTAADVVVKKDGVAVDAKKICCLAQTLGFKGIGYISANAVHLDMRESGSYRGDERSGYGGNVGNDFYAYFGVNTAQITALKTTSATTTMATTSTKNQEEKETMFKDINEVPNWGKEAVQRRIDAKLTDGTDLTESMVRVWVIADRENPIYNDLKDVPDYWLDDVSAMVNAEIIKGDGTHQIAMTHSELKSAVIAWRMRTAK